MQMSKMKRFERNIAGVLKDFFIELPEPLFTNGLYQLLLDAMAVQIADDPQGNAEMMYGIIDCLPRVNQVTTTKYETDSLMHYE